MSTTEEPTAVMRYAVNYVDGDGQPQSDRFESSGDAVGRAQYLASRGREFEIVDLSEADRAEIFENTLNDVAYENLDGPSHYPGIPRQWVVTLESGRQLLVRFTDSSETDIEVAQRSNEHATWSIAEPGVPA